MRLPFPRMLPATVRMLALGAVALAAAACATQTPYGPRDQGGYGYSETRIEQNRFRVAFSGNSLTDQETVETYLLYRAAELTLDQGYDWFEIVDRGTESNRRVVGAGRLHPSPFSYRYYHPVYGWYPWYDPFWDDYNYREVTRFEAVAEIFMGMGDKPADNPRAYDAREVQRNLSTQIQYPTQ
jgi:hypothetical protein